MRDIVIKGEHIVHGIYITVIVILAFALIFKSSDGNSPPIIEEDEEEKEDTIQMIKNASVTIIKNPKRTTTPIIPKTSSTTQTTSPQQNVTQNTTQEEEEPEEELLPITGQIEFTIDKITSEVKGEDWAKVVKIQFTIVNQKPKNFYPKILAYLWDDDDSADIKSYVEEEIYLNKLEAGKSITEEKSVSISFNDIDKEKTLKLVLYNEDDEEMDIVIKKFEV